MGFHNVRVPRQPTAVSQQVCYVDDVINTAIVIAIGREFENGVPFGPTFLSYPLTEIDADYTIGTPNHRVYMGDSSILKRFLH